MEPAKPHYYQPVHQPAFQPAFQQPHQGYQQPQQGYPAYQEPMPGLNLAPQAPPMIMQPQIELGGIQPVIVSEAPPNKEVLLKGTGFERLNNLDGVFIKQRVDPCELVSGCQTENRYLVYPLNKDGEREENLVFKCRERSSYCSHLCLSADCRPFKMEVMKTVKGDKDNKYEPFLLLDRPYKCTCWCSERPELMVRLVEGGKYEYLGKIIEPFTYCNMQANIFDKDNVKKYKIEASCCQLGAWFRWPFEPCQNVSFDVKTPSGEIVSSLEKRAPRCCWRSYLNADHFNLTFPAGATATHKALMICAALLIDFRNFETNSSKRH